MSATVTKLKPGVSRKGTRKTKKHPWYGRMYIKPGPRESKPRVKCRCPFCHKPVTAVWNPTRNRYDIRNTDGRSLHSNFCPTFRF